VPERTSRFAVTAVRDRAADAGIAPRLIAYLRAALGDELIDYASEPSAISGGFDTSVFAFRLAGAPQAFSQPLILRVFRPGSARQAGFESAVQNALAACAFPAPPVLITEQDEARLGGAFTIMPRVEGSIMLGAFFGPRIVRLPALLGRTHAQLHGLDVDRFAGRVEDAGVARTDLCARDIVALQERIERASLLGLQGCMSWLASREPRETGLAVCHGDFHPLNILIDGDGVSGVIDWAGTRIADPAWDVGATVALISQGPVNVPRPLYAAIAYLRRRVVAGYLRAYSGERALDLDAVRYYEALRTLGFAVEAGEKRQQRGGILPPDTRPSAFEGSHVLSRILRRLREITGVTPALPPLVAAPGP
jgi:aminoglycoside phosphotransferase (APT) family kinase protein